VTEPLAALAGRVSDLDAEPVATHPAVLEDVHRGLVSELEALAGAGSAARRPGG
jgi:hypothetical protein